MKANHKQAAVKLTVSKIGTHVMVRVVNKYTLMVSSAYNN